MSSLIDAVGRALGWTVAGLLGIVTLLAAAEVGLWTAFEVSWAPMAEIQGLLMVWVGLLGAAWGVHERFHLGVTMVADRLPPRWRRRTISFATIAVGGFGVMLAWFGVGLVRAVDNTLPATGWPAALHYVPAVVAGGLVGLFALAELLSPHGHAQAEEAVVDG